MRRLLLFLTLSCLLTSGACASLSPLIVSDEASPGEPLAMQALRQDSAGLHFALSASQAPDQGTLEIWRRQAGSELTLQQSVPLTPELARALQSGHVDWSDPEILNLDTSLLLTYRLRLVDTQELSRELHVTALPLPATPDPEAEAHGGPAPQVLLSWRGGAGGGAKGARVLRQDLLESDEFQPLAILDPAAGGELLDHQVVPGGVYAYRFQATAVIDGVLRLSAFSDPLYVAIPD